MSYKPFRRNMDDTKLLTCDLGNSIERNKESALYYYDGTNFKLQGFYFSDVAQKRLLHACLCLVCNKQTYRIDIEELPVLHFENQIMLLFHKYKNFFCQVAITGYYNPPYSSYISFDVCEEFFNIKPYWQFRYPLQHLISNTIHLQKIIPQTSRIKWHIEKNLENFLLLDIINLIKSYMDIKISFDGKFSLYLDGHEYQMKVKPIDRSGEPLPVPIIIGQQNVVIGNDNNNIMLR